MSWIPAQQRFRVARPPLSFRPNGQDVSAFTEDDRDLRRQTTKAEDTNAIRGRWSKRSWCTNHRHFFRHVDATLHVRELIHEHRSCAEAILAPALGAVWLQENVLDQIVGEMVSVGCQQLQ